MIVFTVLVPKNKGLKEYAKIAFERLNSYRNKKLIEVKGEDIPKLVEKFFQQNKKAIGLTGEDLFREYEIGKYNSKLKLIKKIIWDDKKALFKKPVLCLLGPEDKNLEQLPKRLSIGIASRYKLLAKRYLNVLESKGYTFKKFYLNGSTESIFFEGVFDLVIDVVYSGSSMKKAGLKVYDKIFESNFVIIGDKDG